MLVDGFQRSKGYLATRLEVHMVSSTSVLTWLASHLCSASYLPIGVFRDGYCLHFPRFWFSVFYSLILKKPLLPSIFFSSLQSQSRPLSLVVTLISYGFHIVWTAWNAHKLGCGSRTAVTPSADSLLRDLDLLISVHNHPNSKCTRRTVNLLNN